MGLYQIKKKLSPYTYKLKLLTKIKIHPTFYISLLQPLKGKPITCKVPPLPPVIVNNGNGSYFINLINNI
jgi:hypothetical protein